MINFKAKKAKKIFTAEVMGEICAFATEIARRDSDVEQNAKLFNYVAFQKFRTLGLIPDVLSIGRLPTIEMVSEEVQKAEDSRFEDALGRLEVILESMETGEVPLDELVVKYEEGVALLKTCHARLHEAELKIEEVRRKSGTLETEPFEDEPDDDS